MEEFTAITSAISNVGFPIAMCVLFYLYTMKQSERHEKETQALKDTLQQNTTAIMELSTLIKYFIKNE